MRVHLLFVTFAEVAPDDEAAAIAQESATAMNATPTGDQLRVGAVLAP